MKTACLLAFLIASSQLAGLAQNSHRPEIRPKSSESNGEVRVVVAGAPNLDVVAKAKGGEREAQYVVGIMYATGDGVIKNPQEAFRWLKLAAEQGHASAQYSVGVRCSKGEGTAQDNKEACKWLKLAAEQGHSLAQYSLGVRYTKGEGIAQDYAQAAKWFRRAAHHGVNAAQFSIGIRYVEGTGVPRDYVEAYRWFTIAVAQGNQAAGKARENLEKNNLLTAEEIAEAGNRAGEFVAQPRSP